MVSSFIKPHIIKPNIIPKWLKTEFRTNNNSICLPKSDVVYLTLCVDDLYQSYFAFEDVVY